MALGGGRVGAVIEAGALLRDGLAALRPPLDSAVWWREVGTDGHGMMDGDEVRAGKDPKNP